MVEMRAAALVFALGLLAAAPASAQAPTDQQLAQALFDEGRDLMDKGQFAQACPLLERSEKLDPGGGTVLNLAICYEGATKLAKAYAMFNDALSLARKDGRKDREDIAVSHIDSLGPRLPRLRIGLKEQTDSVVVLLDDVLMGAAVLGVLTPVDPGPHHVRVSAMGRVPWEWTGSLNEGQKQEIEATLALPPPPDPCTLDPAKCAPPAPPPPSKRLAVASWVWFGASAVSLGTSIVTGVIALGAKSSYESNCLPDRQFCVDPQAGASDYDRMRSIAWVSTVTLGVALVAAVVGVAWPRTVTPHKASQARY